MINEICCNMIDNTFQQTVLSNLQRNTHTVLLFDIVSTSNIYQLVYGFLIFTSVDQQIYRIINKDILKGFFIQTRLKEIEYVEKFYEYLQCNIQFFFIVYFVFPSFLVFGNYITSTFIPNYNQDKKRVSFSSVNIYGTRFS